MVTGSVVHRVNGLSGASDLYFIFHKGSDNLRGSSWRVSSLHYKNALSKYLIDTLKWNLLPFMLYSRLLYGSHTSLQLTSPDSARFSVAANNTGVFLLFFFCLPSLTVQSRLKMKLRSVVTSESASCLWHRGSAVTPPYKLMSVSQSNENKIR